MGDHFLSALEKRQWTNISYKHRQENRRCFPGNLWEQDTTGWKKINHIDILHSLQCVHFYLRFSFLTPIGFSLNLYWWLLLCFNHMYFSSPCDTVYIISTVSHPDNSAHGLWKQISPIGMNENTIMAPGSSEHFWFSLGFVSNSTICAHMY